MRQKTHSLSRPTTYYSQIKQMLQGMLDLLPVETWLALHEEWIQTNRHVADLRMAIDNNEITILMPASLTPRFCTYCGSDLSLPAGCHACWSDEE